MVRRELFLNKVKKMHKDIEEVKKVLRKHIDGIVEEYNVKLIYIFGSYAKGTNRENSDLDIAIYMEKEIDSFDRLKILDTLIDILQREDIDLVILNKVDIELQFQVIKYGKVIYMKDLLTKVLYESKVMSIYMDMEYFRNTQYEIGDRKFYEMFKINRE